MKRTKKGKNRMTVDRITCSGNQFQIDGVQVENPEDLIPLIQVLKESTAPSSEVEQPTSNVWQVVAGFAITAIALPLLINLLSNGIWLRFQRFFEQMFSDESNKKAAAESATALSDCMVHVLADFHVVITSLV
jgi:hypothetical protein